jgi:5'-phosphate synthase pdxT subunit
VVGNQKVVGILALQGAVTQHADHLRSIGAEPRFVYKKENLAGIAGLILPGGESTTMLKLAHELGMWEELKAIARYVPFWGICAGSILMARHVENPEQPCLGVFDVHVRRNAYGRQLESFQGDVTLGAEREPAVFIRAPQFLSWGDGVNVAGTVNGKPVYLEEGHHCVTAFHPELTNSPWFHERFLKKLK